MPDQTRRHHVLSLAGLGAAGCATPIKTNPYVGTWSGTRESSTGKERIKLVILSQSDARMSTIDGSPAFETKASLVSLSPDNATIEFGLLEERFTGALVRPGILRLKSTAEATPVDFVRGDLFRPEPLSAQTLSKALQSSGSPALGAAFARNGAKATVLVDGVRSSESAVPVTANDKWHLGSVGKSMTATLVARLVEAGGVTWDATIADVLGASVPDMLETYKRVSFRHLLSHHAGLQNNIPDADYVTLTYDRLADAREERLRYASLALRQAPVGAPGEKRVYSNNGYVVAGAMLEVVYKQSWESLIGVHVLEPLGIRSAGFGAPGIAGRLDEPLGHYVSRTDPARLAPVVLGPGKRSDNPFAHGPAGTIHMNLADLITYLNAHLKRPEAFLRPASWATLHTAPFGEGYAMGWWADHNGQLSHNGSNTFWFTYVAVDRATNTVAAAVANAPQPKVGAAVIELFRQAMFRARG